MLHRINPPACGNRLQRILDFQREVLAFACNGVTALPLTQEALRLHFGDAIGDWLWRKQSFCDKLKSLIEYTQHTPDAYPRILNAFDHDIEFASHLDDAAFQFHYHTVLTNADHQSVAEVMKSFYELLAGSGFPSAIHGDGTEPFDRDAWMAAFWDANRQLNVCPACDGQRPDAIEDKVYADVDHFFPRSAYPFLAVHDNNLFPICKECNQAFKRAKDPIDDHTTEPLCNTFHPYERPAIEHVDVCFTREPDTGEPHVSIDDRAGMPSRRVQNLGRLLKLEERWLERSKCVVEATVEAFQGISRRVKRSGETLDANELRIELQDSQADKQRRIGRQPNYVLHVSYLSYAIVDQDEFTELLNTCVSNSLTPTSP